MMLFGRSYKIIAFLCHSVGRKFQHTQFVQQLHVSAHYRTRCCARSAFQGVSLASLGFQHFWSAPAVNCDCLAPLLRLMFVLKWKCVFQRWIFSHLDSWQCNSSLTGSTVFECNMNKFLMHCCHVYKNWEKAKLSLCFQFNTNRL